ncbi:MAG TPA: protein kinase, partial [Vicinamibacteria bacterium]
MTLASGTRLGSYEILGALGAGGMGEVYRASDTKLKREVAIKVLPEAFARDEERMKRFEREAQVLASLNHPNVASIYGVEDADGVHALVLELVEGPTLAERIARGPIPVDEALRITVQIVHGLEAAHEKAVVHRDLKPANVKLTKDGDVKILDFGLAKALEVEPLPVEESNSPTLTRATQVGVLLGTAAYMSPEQAKGKPADRRADVWAFGVVLYEMLTGRRAFAGEDVSETLAHVLTKEPDWTALPPALPMRVRELLMRCLTKDPRKRLQAIGEARIAIEEPGKEAPSKRNRLSPALAGAAGLVLGLSLWALWPRSVPSEARPLRLSVELGADALLTFESIGFGAAAILSPDGERLVFSARESADSQARLYARRLDELDASPLSGTDGASNPFFSPDGKWLAFFAHNKLMKVPVAGGVAVPLADAGQNRGGSWTDDGFIVFAPTDRSPLLRVHASGGTAEPITTLDPATREVTHRWPQVLPGGHALLYTSHVLVGDYEDASLVAQVLPGGERRVLQRGGYSGRYLPSGHLLYVHEGTLYASAFDPERLQMTGDPVPVLQGVLSSRATAGAQFAFSNEGTLVYVPGGTAGGEVLIDWMDREGETSALRAVPGNYGSLRLSPDGGKLATDITNGSQRNVWIYDWEQDILSRLTFDDGEDSQPIWTADGRYLTFGSTRPGRRPSNLYWQLADGTGDVERLSESDNQQFPNSWHPSGKFLAFAENDRETAWDILILKVEGDESTGFQFGAPSAFANTSASEREAAFSPDGRWLAYQSNESGVYEVYVQPFPASGGKWLVSSGGGFFPTWSRNGRELLFRDDDQRIMA